MVWSICFSLSCLSLPSFPSTMWYKHHLLEDRTSILQMCICFLHTQPLIITSTRLRNCRSSVGFSILLLSRDWQPCWGSSARRLEPMLSRASVLPVVDSPCADYWPCKLFLHSSLSRPTTCF